MEQTASELAVLLEGQVVGNPETRVRKLAKIESAGPGSVSFCPTLNTSDSFIPPKPAW